MSGEEDVERKAKTEADSSDGSDDSESVNESAAAGTRIETVEEGDSDPPSPWVSGEKQN